MRIPGIDEGRYEKSAIIYHLLFSYFVIVCPPTVGNGWGNLGGNFLKNVLCEGTLVKPGEPWGALGQTFR